MMVKVVTLSAEARRCLSNNDLSGWCDGVAYSPPDEYVPEERPLSYVPPTPTRVTVGRPLPNDGGC